MLEVKQGDNHSREKCSGMAEQTQCGSHPDYPSKSQDPSVKASIFLRSCLCFLPMAVKQQLHLWGWDQLRSWLITTSELCTLFLPEWLKNESCSQTAGPLPLGSTNTPLPKHVTSLELRSCLRSLLSLSFLAISPRARRWPWSAPRLPSPLSAQQLWTAGLHLLQDFCPHPPEPLPKPPMSWTPWGRPLSLSMLRLFHTQMHIGRHTPTPTCMSLSTELLLGLPPIFLSTLCSWMWVPVLQAHNMCTTWTFLDHA